MNRLQPAFYARNGGLLGDFTTLLHPPYTAWHLSYVVYGAALAPALDWTRLTGTLLAFLLGTGIAAHALDEWHGRPLHTSFSGQALIGLALAGLAGAGAVAIAGAIVISPWVFAWATAGVLLAVGYPLELDGRLHSDIGFALAWGGFPVLVGYWAQTETLTVAALMVALAATLLSLVQRALSTPARSIRRSSGDASVIIERPRETERWDRDRLLSTWERPLRLMSLGVVALAIGLVAVRL